MRASGLSPVRQIRTKRKMKAYPSDLDCFDEQATQLNIGRFKSTYRELIGRGASIPIGGRQCWVLFVEWFEHIHEHFDVDAGCGLFVRFPLIG